MSRRKRKCKVCKNEFYPFNSLQSWCSADCGAKLAKQNLEKIKNKERIIQKRLFRDNDIKFQKEKLKKVFHQYIRERDQHLPCISCGRHHKGQYHAGHYRSSGAMPELRYNELNVNKQCAPCNLHKSGDIVNYRKNLINRIGQHNVDWLEGCHKLHKWTIEEIKDAIDWYDYKLKTLRLRRANNQVIDAMTLSNN